MRTSLKEVLHFIEGLADDFEPSPILVLSGGEPLYRPDIWDIIRFAENKDVPLALATNGTLIDSTTAKRIASSGIQRVSISLDGSCSETHDRFRKIPGSFNKTIRGISHLRSFSIPFQINTTLTRNNLDELDADSLHFFMLVPVGCGMEIKDEFQLSSEEYEESLLKIHQFSREGKIHIRPICAPHYFRILAQNKTPLPRRKNIHHMNQLTKGCLAGTGICFVSHKGEVFPCGYLPIICENIRENSLSDIWKNSDIFGSLREPELLEGKCGLCRFKRICSGCRARAFAETGNFLEEEPNCLYQPEPSKE